MLVLATIVPWWQSASVVTGLIVLTVAIASRSAGPRRLSVARRSTLAARSEGPVSGTNIDGERTASTARFGIAHRWTLRWARRCIRRLTARRAQLISPEHVAGWSDSLARRLRAGESLRAALENDRPEHPALLARTRPLRRSLGNGSSVADAVSVTVQAGPLRALRDPHLELLLSVLAAATEFGGGAAVPIDRVGAALRLRMADGQERAAQSAQARLSAHVLTVVPLGVLALLASTDADVREVSTGGIGLVVVCFGLLLNLVGWWWMNRVIAGEAS